MIEIEEPNYHDGVGFGTLSMIVGSNEFDEGKKLESNSTSAPLSGIVSVIVQDLSPEGLTSTFTINFAFVNPAETETVSNTTETKNQKEIEEGYAAQAKIMNEILYKSLNSFSEQVIEAANNSTD